MVFCFHIQTKLKVAPLMATLLTNYWSNTSPLYVMWTIFHQTFLVMMLLSSKQSCQTNVNVAFLRRNTYRKDFALTRVTNVFLPRGKSINLFQSQRWLKNHCPPEYSASELMPSLTACRCWLHLDVEKCENPDVPCGEALPPVRPCPKSWRYLSSPMTEALTLNIKVVQCSRCPRRHTK